MPKKIKTSTTLVIVESPAKCKKIEEYLGQGYKCIATYGHLRTINSLKNIDITNNFHPTYTIIDEPLKKKQIEILKKEIKKADDIILASDLDREGEMISYTIIELFNLPLNTKRITFNEITKTALNNALLNATTINMNLVYAQQARQILDILVGFKISPMLWKFISNSVLSAGRCQTPALKLIYENQKNIDESVERKVYKICGYFTNLNLPFELNKPLENENNVVDFLEKSKLFIHKYNCSSPKKIYKEPPEPLTTSKIQQMSSNEYHYSPKETMQICQKLYEKGLITYMRTDCKKYSNEFINIAFDYIKNTYGEEYCNYDLIITDTDKNIEKYKKHIQEAHEPIRPTNILVKFLPKDFENKEKKIYNLIWKTTMESCMKKASFYTITATISSPILELNYVYSSEFVDFEGWKIIDNKFIRENKEYLYLKNIANDCVINYKKITSKILLIGNKQHYTESKLVQKLEEKGIGRPSTFSSIVEKIQERGYVKKEDIKGKNIICDEYELEDGLIHKIQNKREFGNEKNKLVIQHLGIIVIEFLEKHFNTLLNYEYTSLMEDFLDKIAKGEKNWSTICYDCNKELDLLINNLKNEKKFDLQIDENNTYIIGKYGPIIKNIEEINGKKQLTFKSIKKDVDIDKIKNGDFSIEEIIDTSNSKKTQIILGKYEYKDVIIQHGKYGLYVTWGNNKISLKKFGNRPIENIKFDEVIEILNNSSTTNRIINKNISIRKGPKGDYIFYKTDKMKKPKFFSLHGFTENYKTCDINLCKDWIYETYNIK